MSRAKRFRLEPQAQPAAKPAGKRSNYVPEFLYESMAGIAAAHGPRRAYQNAKKLVYRERVEFGLVVRRTRPPVANQDQTMLPLGTTPRSNVDHDILHAVELARWTHEPDGIRLVNRPKNKPAPEGNRSALKAQIRQILRDAHGASVPFESLRLETGVLAASLSRCLKGLVHDGSATRWEHRGRVFVRATSRT